MRLLAYHFLDVYAGNFLDAFRFNEEPEREQEFVSCRAFFFMLERVGCHGRIDCVNTDNLVVRYALVDPRRNRGRELKIAGAFEPSEMILHINIIGLW